MTAIAPSSLKLVEYWLMEQPTLPPIPWPRGYVIAQNGIFAWAKREGLEALIPVASCTLEGLYPVEPYVHLDYPPVDSWLLSEVLRLALEAHTPDGNYQEILMYLVRDQRQGWLLTLPHQKQEELQVSPLLDDSSTRLAYANTLIEIHSHHRMHAFFSHQDNRDELGFRITGVIGCVDTQPEIRVRVGIYGHFWEVPASCAFALPWDIIDCVVQDPVLPLAGCEYERRVSWYEA